MRSFVLILAAALASSILGALFAVLVALVSPEFVSTLIARPSGSVARYAAGIGMVWGLFLGAAVMAFSLLMSGLARLTRALDAKREDPGKSGG